jgi:hypothetical protein
MHPIAPVQKSSCQPDGLSTVIIPALGLKDTSTKVNCRLFIDLSTLQYTTMPINKHGWSIMGGPVRPFVETMLGVDAWSAWFLSVRCKWNWNWIFFARLFIFFVES